MVLVWIKNTIEVPKWLTNIYKLVEAIKAKKEHDVAVAGLLKNYTKLYARLVEAGITIDACGGARWLRFNGSPKDTSEFQAGEKYIDFVTKFLAKPDTVYLKDRGVKIRLEDSYKIRDDGMLVDFTQSVDDILAYIFKEEKEESRTSALTAQ